MIHTFLEAVAPAIRRVAANGHTAEPAAELLGASTRGA
jgi:hypothetical protein